MDNDSTLEEEKSAWEKLNAFEDDLERRENALRPKLILIGHHGFLYCFYESELRFTKEFEQDYRIAKDFDILRDYYDPKTSGMEKPQN